ncbi:kinesin-like protein Klp61F [Aricia agestis]|uniref:kinesin-like protein Klp61F n=1 Tax=Aricia agestis TaxID=91739 RepID=UPI001C205898|nr:kinesin-like protein Klp61F [Aricia agestis]
MTSEKANRKERKENQNIQVFVRLRPLNQREKDIRSLGVVEVVNGREVVVRPSNQTLHTKKFTFDRAFPPYSKQVEVYQQVVSPLIEEVLAGYNCTVFAYGQTGTGKTHTMVGEAAADETTWQSDPLAGIIPRALSQLFDELRLSNTEYTVRVSYLELYNEELFDLLSSSDDNSKLRIYEDVTRKGANIVNGLEEITVYNKNEVYRIMAQGQERKKVASTLMNAQSSRSHTVFTIVVHMKENSPEGEELVKIGKLNLVDLAGSENISKAGSDNPAKRERARECVNINQSLLTLGRVITALVERHPHIPYRESKLTRILQESLGGRTKTSIIATISPGHKDLEETLSTLEYANRAKNIQNKPEINQKMTKKAILKEYAEEIDKLKKDLQAARDKNGIYLANETYAEMTFKQEEQKKEIQELLLKKRAMEEERDRMENVFEELRSKLQNSEGQLTETISKLNTTKTILEKTTTKLVRTEQQCSEQRSLVEAAVADVDRLHDAVDRRSTVESRNLETTQRYRGVSAQMRHNMRAAADRVLREVATHVTAAGQHLESHTTEGTGILSNNKTKMDALFKHIVDNFQMMTQAKENLYSTMNVTLTEQHSALTNLVQNSHQTTKTAFSEFTEAVAQCLWNAGQMDVSTQMTALLEEWVSNTGVQLQATRNTHGSSHALATRAALSHAAAVRAARDAAARTADTRARHVQRVLQAIKADEEQNKKMLADNMAKIEKEREHREAILEQRIERKRNLLQEEREQKEAILEEWIARKRILLQEEMEKRKTAVEQEIEELMKTEREYLEAVMESHRRSIAEQKQTFEASTSRNVQMLMELLTESEREMQISEEEYHKNETEMEKCVNELNGLAEKYKQESGEVECSVSELSGRVLNVAEQLKARLLAELQQSEHNIKSESSRLLSSSSAAAQAQAAGLTAALQTVSTGCRHAVDGLLSELDRQSSSTTQELSALSSSTSRCVELLGALRDAQASALGSTRADVEQLHASLQNELTALQQLEERCLHDEYTVYTPSGCTPARGRYAYPRRFAASPLKKLPSTLDEDDVIILDDDATNGHSDSSSCASEDSASWPRANEPSATVKCNSETDIYLRMKQHEQGKENSQVNRSMSFKKPSRLPAPSTAKKILAERNGVN